MTLPYSATFPTLFDYFKIAMFDTYQINVRINEDMGKVFLKFYKFLKNFMQKSGPFLNEFNELIFYFIKNLDKNEPVRFIFKNGDIVDLSYYETQTKHFDFIVRLGDSKRRIIKNYTIINKNILNKKKTNSALNANIVHAVDSLLVRDINTELFQKYNCCYISIHDSFLVDFTSVSEFLTIANVHVNNDIFKSSPWLINSCYFSIFLFI
jgi:hypothetical protein